MNEQEENAFRAAYMFYERWRETIIEKDEDWNLFAEDVGSFCRQHGNHPLGQHLITAVLETFNDLYRGGMKPMPSGYFGRDDLST